MRQSGSAQITSHVPTTTVGRVLPHDLAPASLPRAGVIRSRDQSPSFSCSSAMCFGVPTRYFTKVSTPSASIANVERIVPWTFLPYMFFSPQAP